MTNERGELLLPSAASARKYVDNRIASGIRGTAEESLRVVRGRVDTTAPTILQGSGFTVAKNGTGDITITFTTAFSAIPSVNATGGGATGADLLSVQELADPTVSTCRLGRKRETFGLNDGVVIFTAIGPE